MQYGDRLIESIEMLEIRCMVVLKYLSLSFRYILKTNLSIAEAVHQMAMGKAFQRKA